MTRRIILLAVFALLPVSNGNAAPKKSPRHLVFYGVTTTGALPASKARKMLRIHTRDRLGACAFPSQKKGSLPGSVRVTGKLTKTGRLRISRFVVTSGHKPYEACLRKVVSRWRLSSDKAHAGSTVRFTFYVSFSRRVGILGALAGKRGYGVAGVLGGGGSSAGIGGLGTRGSGYRSRYGPRYNSKATITSVGAKGALSQGVVTWAIKQLRLENNVRHCHRAAAKRRADLSGRYELGLRVGKNGSLDKIELIKSTIDDAHMQSCVMRYLLRYSSYNPVTTFPSSKGTTEVKVTLEFPKAQKR